MNQSIATINSPEFINLQPLDINPGLAACEIKVLYVGGNRNQSFISKEVATEMSKTLRGAPIVGYFKKDAEDFGDHGQSVTIDGDGIHFDCLTKPYGFVAPDAKVWFQTFDEVDAFGEPITREYLMTTGYLWVGQFEECKSVIENGKSQSMELDEKTLNGEWTKNYQNGLEFFIINDATFTKLCILGDDVEPCFEGASVTAPSVSKKFSLDNNFKTTLYSMMQDLKTIVSKGGTAMENENLETELPQEVPAENVDFNLDVEIPLNGADAAVESEKVEENEVPVEFKEKKDDEEKKEEAPAEDKKSEDKEADSSENKEDEDEKEDDKKKNFSLVDELEKKYSELTESYAKLQADYSALDEKYQVLVQFKNEIDNKKKDELIASFYMLSDEDKKDVIDNKATYSLDEIESKLSVLCFRKKVSFEKEEAPAVEENAEEQPSMIFNLEDNVEAVPGYIQAIRNIRKNK